MNESLGWFPFYVEKFLASKRTRKMKAEAVGIYVLLMCEQWEEGFVDDSDAELAFIGRADLDKVREVLGACFERTAAGWVNRRLEEIREEQLAKMEKKSAAASVAARARWDGNANAMRSNAIRSRSREEVEIDKKKESKPRARALPEDWTPNDKHRAIAKNKGVNVEEEAEAMRDWAAANGARKIDWDRTFNGWLRRAKAMAPRRTFAEDKDESAAQAQRAWLAQRGGPLVPVITERKAKQQPTPDSGVKPGNIQITLNGPASAA